MSENTTTLKFLPFSTAIESSFWVRYCTVKLETIQLDESAIPITLHYGIGNSQSALQCQQSSLDPTIPPSNETVTVSASLIGYNTQEAFLKTDKNELLRDGFCSKFFSGDDVTALESLSSATLITFADLKNHRVIYWFAIPVLVPRHSIRCVEKPHEMDVPQLEALYQAVYHLRRQTRANGLFPYFLYSESGRTCALLSKVNYDGFCNVYSDAVIGFFDPSPPSDADVQSILMVGWPMRNLIAYLCFHLNLAGQTVPILRYQPKIVRRIVDDHEDMPTNEDVSKNQATLLSVAIPAQDDYAFNNNHRVVGWELNARSKPGPRSVNLRPLIDPQHLAIQAADLNLKLMKWRMIPKLKVEELQKTKVLLIGAGTLGCNVARVLLGWGIRNFTIVDYGKVSYSNPVRQSLFTLDDCHANGGSGRPKAEAAAEALRSIAADVISEGITLSIPMPGHPDDPQSIQKAVETLDALVQESDVVFLLTDTRESRWLPTVMGSCYGKMLINAALGLDSWLVMRHGIGGDTKLGCYFCNDVVAPENSTKNRTMDQQCTVTRPGLALIASSMAVEMMVALMHHSEGPAAPAPIRTTSNFTPTVSPSDPSACPLGIIPHQVRGSLVTYTMMTPSVPAFQFCTGCSNGVVNMYKQDKVATVQSACQNTSSYLEGISGLTTFRAEEAERMVGIEDWDDDEV